MSKVLFVHPSADRYGSDLQLVESVRAYQDAGWDVAVSLPGQGPLVEMLPETPIDYRRTVVLRKRALNLRGLIALVSRAFIDLVALTRFLSKQRPDLVYVNTMVIPMWIVAAKLRRVPVLVHVHEAEEPGGLVGIGIAAPLLLADTVIANSVAAREALARSISALRARIAVVHNGVVDQGPMPPAQNGPPHQLVYIGRLSPRKGVDVALEAVGRLVEAGLDVSLNVCGTAFAGYEEYELSLRRRAGEPDLAGRVEFLGYVRPLSEVLRKAHVLLVPSRLEPFGNIAVEGLLAERAVVAARTQGLCEIIRDGETGVLFDAGDPAALADAVAALLGSPVKIREMARAGREDACKRFSVPRYRADVVHAGESILCNRGGR